MGDMYRSVKKGRAQLDLVFIPELFEKWIGCLNMLNITTALYPEFLNLLSYFTVDKEYVVQDGGILNIRCSV